MVVIVIFRVHPGCRGRCSGGGGGREGIVVGEVGGGSGGSSSDCGIEDVNNRGRGQCVSEMSEGDKSVEGGGEGYSLR